jgi:hypothetical protein
MSLFRHGFTATPKNEQPPTEGGDGEPTQSKYFSPPNSQSSQGSPIRRLNSPLRKQAPIILSDTNLPEEKRKMIEQLMSDIPEDFFEIVPKVRLH